MQRLLSHDVRAVKKVGNATEALGFTLRAVQ